MAKKHDDAKHGSHLCEVAKKGVNEPYKGLVKDAKFICTGCGRVAANEDSLCAPEPLAPAPAKKSAKK